MIYLSLRMYAAIHGIGVIDEPNGPLFHKWLPDGETDALHFASIAPPNALRVWFTRRGYVNHGMIEYDFGRHEVDVSIMRRQGWLDAGPLQGEAVFTHVTQSELAAVGADKKGDENYISLAKRVVDFLLPPMQSLYDTLSLQYGQYWVPELKPWDSRNMSLGGYCQSTFGLQWRTDVNAEWKKFLPDDPSHTVRVMPIPGRGYGEFLTESDWRDIQSSLDAKPAHPLALRVAGRAHELSNSGYLAEAYIQAVTALELAIEHFIHLRGQSYSKGVSNHAKAFTDQSLTSQLSVLALVSGAIDSETLNRAIRAIDTRNKIVHEARQPASLPIDDLLALMRCIQVLLGVKEYKSPRLINGNWLDAPPPGAA